MNERIIIIGDMHFSDDKFYDYKYEMLNIRDEFFYEFFKYIESIPNIDSIISIGDLTHAGSENEFNSLNALIEKTNIDFHYITGNHDLFLYPRRNFVNKDYYSGGKVLEFNNTRIILLETARDQFEEDWSGIVNAEQLTWLSNIIASTSDNMRIIIISHHPIYGTTSLSKEYLMAIDNSSDVLNILFQRNNGDIFINGHTHINSISHLNNWHFISLSSLFNYPAIYLLTMKESIQLESILIPNKKLVKMADKLGQKLKGYNYQQNEMKRIIYNFNQSL